MPQRHGCQRDGDIAHVFERQGFDQRPGQGYYPYRVLRERKPFSDTLPTWVLSSPNPLRQCMFVHIM